MVKLPVEIAKELLRKKIICINWSDCLVRELMQPIKCYKCWHYGYIATKCESEEDISTAVPDAERTDTKLEGVKTYKAACSAE